MPSHHVSNHDQKYSAHSVSNRVSINDTNHRHKWPSLAGCALLLGGATMVLAGCQSSPTVSQSAGVSGSLIDFNSANTAQNQAQGRAFNASLNAKSEHYAQLFDQSQYPNTENQAKLRLLTAIRQHLATEHVAVAQANYQAVPFIHPDSIDAGSSSLLRTIIETYAYKKAASDDYGSEYDSDYEGYDEYGEYDAVEEAAAEAEEAYDYDAYVDAADEVVVVEEEAYESAAIEYDEYGYDEDGFDQNGYDRDGYDWYGYDEEGYDPDGYDEYGYDRYGDSLEDDYSRDADNSLLSKMSGLQPRKLLKNYEAMQTAKQQGETASAESEFPPSSSAGMVGQLLSMIHRTPEQVAASNAYQYQNLTFNSVSQYKPKQKQLQSVYSYDYVTPTISSSVQIPLAFDFANSSITVDPSAIMPIVALANPDNTPLPAQMTSHTVNFGLPESIASQLPSAVIYDAAIAAIQDSMAELAPEHFSAVDIRGDQFAKQVGASKAVKVYFGSQQTGEMIGKMLKYMTQSLQGYVDANPEKYPDGAKLKTAIDKLQLYNKGYQSADVGALLQLIEAIAPISFNQINYYYLDSSDRLLAKQQRINIGGDLMGSTTTVVNQIRYDKASFNKHALTPLLAESFGSNATPAIDGNAWIAKQRQHKERLRAARYARYDYDYNDDSYMSDYDTQYDITDAEDDLEYDVAEENKF